MLITEEEIINYNLKGFDIRVLYFIRLNKNITTSELSEKLNKSSSLVSRSKRNLKNNCIF